MRYYRCKCGNKAAWSSMGIQECDGCPDCNTTLEESPEHHSTPKPHEWREGWTIDKTSGERSKERVCACCYKREAMTDEQVVASAIATARANVAAKVADELEGENVSSEVLNMRLRSASQTASEDGR